MYISRSDYCHMPATLTQKRLHKIARIDRVVNDYFNANPGKGSHEKIRGNGHFFHR